MTGFDLSVVIPVYQGERTLPALIGELAPYFQATLSPDGHAFVVSEILLVNDNGPDGSATTIRAPRMPGMLGLPPRDLT